MITVNYVETTVKGMNRVEHPRADYHLGAALGHDNVLLGVRVLDSSARPADALRTLVRPASPQRTEHG